jgi:hypothetical protein
MALRDEIERILSPAIDCRAPYAKVMIDQLCELLRQDSAPQNAPSDASADLDIDMGSQRWRHKER